MHSPDISSSNTIATANARCTLRMTKPNQIWEILKNSFCAHKKQTYTTPNANPANNFLYRS